MPRCCGAFFCTTPPLCGSPVPGWKGARGMSVRRQFPPVGAFWRVGMCSANLCLCIVSGLQPEFPLPKLNQGLLFAH